MPLLHRGSSLKPPPRRCFLRYPWARLDRRRRRPRTKTSRQGSRAYRRRRGRDPTSPPGARFVFSVSTLWLSSIDVFRFRQARGPRTNLQGAAPSRARSQSAELSAADGLGTSGEVELIRPLRRPVHLPGGVPWPAYLFDGSVNPSGPSKKVGFTRPSRLFVFARSGLRLLLGRRRAVRQALEARHRSRLMAGLHRLEVTTLLGDACAVASKNLFPEFSVDYNANVPRVDSFRRLCLSHTSAPSPCAPCSSPRSSFALLALHASRVDAFECPTIDEETMVEVAKQVHRRRRGLVRRDVFRFGSRRRPRRRLRGAVRGRSGLRHGRLEGLHGRAGPGVRRPRR